MDKSHVLEQAKAKLIERYVVLQDQADEINKQIYELTIEIETLNGKIQEARDESARAKKM